MSNSADKKLNPKTVGHRQLDVICAFDVPRTAKEVAEALRMNKDNCNFHVLRALKNGFLTAHTMARRANSRVLAITPEGVQFLKDVSNAQKQFFEKPIHEGAQFFTTLLNAPATKTTAPVIKSRMDAPVYVPPKDDCPRAGGLDFKRIKSRGL